MSVARPDSVIFDIGGVLLDWDPRYLYRKLFADPEEMERFLAEVCTPEWHAAHDRGIPFADSCRRLAGEHPRYEAEIRAWGERSEEMEAGQIEGSVAVLGELVQRRVPVYALTNMERETYPRRVRRYPFMSWFDGTVASFQEGVVKPDAEIFRRLLERYELDPRRTVMIDDSERNLRTARTLGLLPIHFRTPSALRAQLVRLGLLPP